tara:strand:- start:3318 stop:4487 length:1170 start_codon:yes stop_codon:yes gene_type:complete
MIKKANLEPLMPTIYTKLKSLGEINDVVPIGNIVSGLSKGDARAYVSNEDKNTDGIPDKIYIVYPRLNIDLQQDLLGVTTADITAFPNLESQKIHQVSNILAAVTNVLNHEQDHLKGFKSNNGTDEFSPEHLAEHAGDEAAKNFINKYTSLSINNYGKNKKMINNLKKLSLHLKNIKEESLAKDLDIIIANSDCEGKTGEQVNQETQDSMNWLNSDNLTNNETDNQSHGTSDLVSEAIDKYAKEQPGLALSKRVRALFAKFQSLNPITQLPTESLRMFTKYYGKPMTTSNREEDLVANIDEAEKAFENPNLLRENVLGRKKKVDRQLSLVRAGLAKLLPYYQRYEKDQEDLARPMDFLPKRRYEGVTTSADKSLNLDNLFASSIMGPRK